MGRILLHSVVMIFIGQGALAQTLVPATSDDLSDFDRQVSQSRAASAAPTKASFGAAVASEAKRLQSAHAQQKGKLRQNSLATSHDKVSSDAGSADNDGKMSSPVNSDRGNSANAPGHNKQK